MDTRNRRTIGHAPRPGIIRDRNHMNALHSRHPFGRPALDLAMRNPPVQRDAMRDKMGALLIKFEALFRHGYV